MENSDAVGNPETATKINVQSDATSFRTRYDWCGQLLADSVAKLPKCRGINFSEIDQTAAIAERRSLQAITDVAREFIAG